MTSSRKNILVLKNYTITDHTQWYDDRTNEKNLVDNYAEMEKICIESAKQNIQDLDDIHVFRGEASNIRDVFKINFFEIYDLWKQGHNLLYADLDVVFMNPCNMFDKTYLFSMYNLTDPPSTSDSHYNVDFQFYFNCGMRYYPHKMLQEVWDIGIEMFENFNTERWDAEQIIYNSMMWWQSPHMGDFWNPLKAYQMLNSPLIPGGQQANQQFNAGYDIKEVDAVHIHGSRGSSDRLEIMKRLQERTLPAVEETLFL